LHIELKDKLKAKPDCEYCKDVPLGQACDECGKKKEP